MEPESDIPRLTRVEIVDILECESYRQKTGELSEESKRKMKAYDIKDTSMYNLLVDYVESNVE